MERLPKDIRQLIFWHVWKMNIQNCHKEILNKKLFIVDFIMDYFNCDELRDHRWKNIRFEFSSRMKNLLFAKMIDHLEYFCHIQIIHVFGEPEDADARWEQNVSCVFENIHRTRKWQDIPNLPISNNPIT